MADTLDKAIDKLRALPPKRRRAIAAIIEDYLASEVEPVHILSEEERALVEEGLAELNRGEYATEPEVEAVFARHRRS